MFYCTVLLKMCGTHMQNEGHRGTTSLWESSLTTGDLIGALGPLIIDRAPASLRFGEKQSL
jgi:hypothetical protein